MKKIFAILLFATLANLGVSGAQTCVLAVADLDVAINAVKLACVNKPTPAPTPVAETWTKCADEGGTCSFSGTRQVHYGVVGKWFTKTATGSIACNNTAFGDPAVGIAKKCEYSSAVSTNPPAPTPTPVIVNPTPVPPSTGGGSGIFIGSQEFASLADVAAAVKDGQTINITKSIDNQSAAFTNPITVNVKCAAGVKITYSAGTSLRPAWGKGIFVLSGVKNFNMQGCDVSGMLLHKDLGGNGAAVRIDDNVESVTLDGVNFSGNNNGVLGGSKKLYIKNSRLDRNGVSSGAYDNVHNIYISAYTDLLEISDSYFGRVTPAHTLKSRAKTTIINNCKFESSQQFDGSYLADFPNGGNVLIQNSTFLKAPGQSQRSVLAYAMENFVGDGRVNKMEVHHNLFVSDMNANFLAYNYIDNPASVFNFHDNTMVGEYSGQIAQTNTKVYANRSDAGLTAAPSWPTKTVMGFLKTLF